MPGSFLEFAPHIIQIYCILYTFSCIKRYIMYDLVGQSFGKWLVLELVGRNGKGERTYLCECSCGIKKVLRSSMLRRGDSIQCKQCFLSILNKTEDLTGKTFGSWLVTQKVKNKKRNEWFYKCVCSCGTKKQIAAHHLKSKSSTQCHKCRCKTHGMSYTATFKIWTGVLRRCLNKNFQSYKYYGGRGITVCDRWLKFENFLEDMGVRPPLLQIDRINNDGNYEPGNCRWVTSKENNSNKRSSAKRSLECPSSRN